MSEYKTIEKKLLGVGQAQLQDIVSQITYKQYAPINIINLGSASGVDTTRAGTPDSFLQLSSGNYIYVEVTIQKSQLMNKIRLDLEKCQATAKSAINNNAIIEKVIFACLGKVETIDLQECQDLCNEFCFNQECPFEFWGLDKLTLLLSQNYPSIAVSELGIQMSCGLLTTLDTHLQNDKYDVSQTHDFLFRENEERDIKNKLLEKRIVLLSGSAGCGKTRLCIHLAQVLKDENAIKEVFFIKQPYENIFPTLLTAANNESVAVILDDINRFPCIEEFIQFVQQHKNIFVFATVRDYALTTIKNQLQAKGLSCYLHFIPIDPLSKDQQEKVLKKILPNISYDVLFAIQRVAHENLRFAVMMAELLKKQKSIPAGINELLELHFQQVNSDLKNAIDTDNLDYLKSLVILSFFHRIVSSEGDRNWTIIGNAINELGITCDTFRAAMFYWYKQEVVNISFDGIVYSIEDQILANYLFYKLVIEKKQISLKKLFELLFPRYRKCFVDLFNSLLPAYGAQDSIIEPLTNLWNTVYKQKNNDETIAFISAFYGLLPIETLSYIKEKELPLKNEFIPILCGFKSSKYYNTAIDLLFDHIQKFKITDETVKELTNAFTIDRHSFSSGLKLQEYFLKKLLTCLNNTNCKCVFLAFARKMLDTRFDSTESHTNEIVYFTIPAIPCIQLFQIRALVWKGLFELYSNGCYKELRKLLNAFRYAANSDKLDDLEDIFKNDQTIILPFARNESLNPLSFNQKVVLKLFLECCCNDRNPDFQKVLRKIEITSSDFLLYSKVFSRNKESRMNPSLQSKDYECIFAKMQIPEDFYSYVSGLHSIETSKNTITFAVDEFFKYIDSCCSEFFQEYLKTFILKFAALNIDYMKTASILAKNYDIEDIINYIVKSQFPNKRTILLDFLQYVPQEKISIGLYDLCFETIKEEFCTCDSISQKTYRLCDFITYEHFKQGFICKVFKTIQESTNNNPAKYALIEDFYEVIEPNGWSCKGFSKKDLALFFGNDLESVFFELFFAAIKNNGLLVSEKFINYIATIKIEYLYRYYDLFFIHDNRFKARDYLDVAALKNFPDIENNLLTIYERSKLYSKIIVPVHEMKEIMSKNLTNETYMTFIELFIDKYISNMKDLQTMAWYLSSLNSQWQIIYAQNLISKEIPLESFKKISLFSFPSSWSGSATFMYEKIVETIKKFLEETPTTIDNVSYINYIKELQSELVEEKKRAQLHELSNYDFFA